MVVGEIAEPVDLLVIGGGPGGYTAALRAAELGRQVTLVERRCPPLGEDGAAPEDPTAAMGGECLHVGCIPSKALIELACTLERAHRLGPAGLELDGARVDLARFQAWRREITERLAAGVDVLLGRAGVEVLAGEARFARHDRVAVRTPDDRVRFLEFRHAVLATGSRPAPLAALPVDGTRVLDSTGALALTSVPDSAAVIGGGYIGVELGTALAKLGAHVTLVEAEDRLLAQLDPALVRPVVRRLGELGVDVRTGAVVEGLDGADLRLADGQRVPAAVIVAAVGRLPNTDDMGLERAGVPLRSDGLVAVGEDRRATPTVAAIGDVIAGPALAHRAAADAALAVDALCGRPVDDVAPLVCEVVFSDPEIATVGLTESQARDAGFDVVASNVPHAASGRAATMAEREGFTRVVADRATDRIVGVQVVGPHASELIGEGALAIEMIAAPGDLAETIHPHPTVSETLTEAAHRLRGAVLQAMPSPRVSAVGNRENVTMR